MTDWRDSLKALMPDLPEGADQPAADEAPPAKPKLPRLDIYVERKGRGGKVATIITGFADDDAADAAAATLKKRLGAGGSARGGEVLIQGERADQCLKALADLGYKATIKCR